MLSYVGGWGRSACFTAVLTKRNSDARLVVDESMYPAAEPAAEPGCEAGSVERGGGGIERRDSP